jgi:hypothetical protein
MEGSNGNGYFQAFVRLRSRPGGERLAPEELRPRLVADAEARGSNLTDVANEILAARYRVPFEPTGRKTAASPDGEELNLRIPWDLKTAIGAEANVHGRSLQREILAALCDHYGLALPEPPQRTRARAA